MRTWQKAIVNATVALGMALMGVPAAAAMPTGGTPVTVGTGGDVVPVAKKTPRKTKKAKTKSRNKAPVWHKTRRGEGRLEGRVADIDRREGRRRTASHRQPVGRVPSRNRQADSEAFNQLMLGAAAMALRARGFGGGASGGCGIDVTTPNPTGCGTRFTDSGGSNGLRPPYQCMVNGRVITTNTFRAGCWMVRQNNLAIPMGR